MAASVSNRSTQDLAAASVSNRSSAQEAGRAALALDLVAGVEAAAVLPMSPSAHLVSTSPWFRTPNLHEESLDSVQTQL